MRAAGKKHIWYRSRSDTFRLWHLSDLHWGSKACAEDKIRADIKTIRADPFAFWFGGGDYCEFIGHTDNRFDPDSVAPWVSVKDLGDLGRVSMQRLSRLLKPIAHKCLGLLIGNHEKRYEQATDQDSLHGWLCTSLGVSNLEYCALVDVVFNRTQKCRVPKLMPTGPGEKQHGTAFRVFLHHGAGFATTPGGKLNRLVQFMQTFDADLYLCGHVHDRVARREPAICADRTCTQIGSRDRLGAVAGSYLKTYQQDTTTYGEQRGYRPTSLGAAIISITPETRMVEAAV